LIPNFLGGKRAPSKKGKNQKKTPKVWENVPVLGRGARTKTAMWEG